MHWFGRQRQFWHLAKERYLTGQMAITAVGMDLDHVVGIIRQVCVGVMLVRMVAEMLRRFFTVVLAIRGRRCPGELERQYSQQKDEQQFFHGRNDITEVRYV